MEANANPTSTNAAKYASGNPLVRRLLDRFLDRVVGAVCDEAPARIIDLGCGEGLVGERIMRALPSVDYRGIELTASAAHEARRRLPNATIEQGNLLEVSIEDEWADLALCLEVLEHLETPEIAVSRIAAWTRGSAVLSVPFEPWFRLGNLARGKYLRHLGNHPEHIQQFGTESFRALLQPHFSAVSVEVVFPWLVARCRR
ncbi:MAG: class I SAM-dependent methyltransferase [Myxococcota bacterium]